MKARMKDGSTADIKAVWFENGKVRMIDQRKLPLELVITDFDDYRGVAEAIRNMTTRGAPCIGASAAYAMCAYADMTVSKCRAIGEYGGALIKDGMKLMTHCNAGALATVDVGTALAPMRNAHNAGKKFFVYASETRPRLQGMQLTAWELNQEGIDHAIIPDGASAYYMSQGVDMIIVGADRIAANGDFANKIGTFDKAICAKRFGIPFYVAAPVSTFDFSTLTGKDIVIEQRAETEVTEVNGMRIAPVGSKALNPAFDVTPAELVTGFITEKGIFRPSEISEMKE